MSLYFWLIFIFLQRNKNKWGVSFFAIFGKVSFLSLFVILIVGFQRKIKHLESIWDHPVSRLNSNIRFLKLLLGFSGKRKQVEISLFYFSFSLIHTHIHTHEHAHHQYSAHALCHKHFFFLLILIIILSRTRKNWRKKERKKEKCCLDLILMEDNQLHCKQYTGRE